MQIEGIANLHLSETNALTQVRQSQEFERILEDSVKRIQQGDKKRSELFQACKGLESVFINQMLQSMRRTVPESNFLGSSFAMDTFQSMLFEEYSKIMNQQQSFGIAEALYQQLTGERYRV